MTPREELVADEDEDELFSTAYFATEVLPILHKVLHVSGITYQWRDVSIVGENDLRKWLCTNGLPLEGNVLDKEERKILNSWVSYANVVHSDFSKGYSEFSEGEIVALLKNRLKLKETEKGVYMSPDGEFVGDIQQLREELRRVDILGLFGRHERFLSKEERANLRVWAARSPQIIPLHPSCGRAETNDQINKIEKPYSETKKPRTPSLVETQKRKRKRSSEQSSQATTEPVDGKPSHKTNSTISAEEEDTSVQAAEEEAKDEPLAKRVKSATSAVTSKIAEWVGFFSPSSKKQK